MKSLIIELEKKWIYKSNVINEEGGILIKEFLSDLSMLKNKVGEFIEALEEAE